jgi:hypothetical protein
MTITTTYPSIDRWHIEDIPVQGRPGAVIVEPPPVVEPPVQVPDPLEPAPVPFPDPFPSHPGEPDGRPPTVPRPTLP